MAGYRALQARLANWSGTIGEFAEALDREQIPYLSFSKTACVEFCGYRYLLEYVQLKRPSPEPDYFAKGQAFHETVASLYRDLAQGRPADADSLLAGLGQALPGRIEVENAIRLAAQNAYEGFEVVAVEEPFVLSLGRDLPPCVGVIDLILRRGKTWVIVDHKTGKRFNEADELQLVLYREHVRRQYKAIRCLAFVDQYRWVPNLARIRKPAFQRTPIRLARSAWPQATQRLARAHSRIREIEKSQEARGGGECYLCPYKSSCRKASVGYSSYWY